MSDILKVTIDPSACGSYTRPVVPRVEINGTEIPCVESVEVFSETAAGVTREPGRSRGPKRHKVTLTFFVDDVKEVELSGQPA